MTRLAPGVTVVTPTIPERRRYLDRAVRSVRGQSWSSRSLYQIVVEDDRRRGAALTRTLGAQQVNTEWTAFLDDDDQLMPNHIEALLTAADGHGADYVYADFIVPQNRAFHLPSYCYGPWDPEQPLQTTVTVLVKTELGRAAGWFLRPNEDELVGDDRAGEDYGFTLRCNAMGSIYHLRQPTWLWNHHGANTSGLPERRRRTA